MSDRINYTDDEPYPGAFELWQANCDRSIGGRKGQAALRELEVALLALPSKRLVSGELDNGADVCAIGALVRHKGITPKADPEFEMEEVGVECGMPPLVAWKVVEENDHMGDWRSTSPEQRYERMLAWTRMKLKESV